MIPFARLTGAVVAALLWLGACATAETRSPGPTSSAPIVIDGVTILPMTEGGAPIEDGRVVLTGERISMSGTRDAVPMPRNARVIDGRGRFLMPGLADMHVHIENDGLWRRMFNSEPPAGQGFEPADILLPYVANGVTQVLNLSSDATTLAQRDLVESGQILGPHIASAVMVDGAPPLNPGMARVASTPEQGRALVAEIQTAGHDAVKVYSNLDLETYRAILDEASRRGLKVVGHIPLRGADRTEELLDGLGLVAHAEEFAYQPPTVDVAAIPKMAALARAKGVWLITTLKLNERVVEMTRNDPAIWSRPELRFVSPLLRDTWRRFNRYAQSADRLERREAVVRYNPVLLRTFAEAGVPIIVGTDTLVAGIIPGFGLHDELEALAEIGLPERLILEAATRLPAEWLGVARDRGTIEAGKRADLLLLEEDPLRDVSNTRRIAAVFINGRLLTRSEIDARMEELATRYAQRAPSAPSAGDPVE